jgi:hypothetical protein
MCQKLPRPQAVEVDGNVYARSAGRVGQPLVVWSPAATESCSAAAASLAEFRSIAPGLEARGRQIDRGPASILKGPDVGRYELLRELPGAAPAAVGASLRARSLPPDVQALLGWTEQEAAHTVGAYPVRR